MDYFWQQQEYFAGGGKGRKGKGYEDTERSLFGAQRENVGIDFDKYDDIPVDLSGDGAEKIYALESFDELWERYDMHDFLWENLQRCHYSRPTPIQRFAIPVALGGNDAMCCAQTGSGHIFMLERATLAITVFIYHYIHYKILYMCIEYI